MNEEVIAVFIPMVFFLVTGLVLVTFFYFRSREKQMLIEKGLSPEEIKQMYVTEKKKDSYVMLKIGLISLFFGIGLGIGLIMEDYTSKEYWIPLFLFTFAGLGFIAANLIGMKLKNKESLKV